MSAAARACRIHNGGHELWHAVIATAVGGTGEIVHDKVNGVLLDKDFSINQLCEKISAFSQMGDDEYIAFLPKQPADLEELCDANKNYSRFVAGIENL